MSRNRLIWIGLGICLLLAGVLSYYASSAPDGLQRVASDLGFGDHARDSATAGSPLAGYQTAGVAAGHLSEGLAGVLGVLVTAALAFGLFWLLARRNRSSGPESGA